MILSLHISNYTTQVQAVAISNYQENFTSFASSTVVVSRLLNLLLRFAIE